MIQVSGRGSLNQQNDNICHEDNNDSHGSNKRKGIWKKLEFLLKRRVALGLINEILLLQLVQLGSVVSKTTDQSFAVAWNYVGLGIQERILGDTLFDFGQRCIVAGLIGSQVARLENKAVRRHIVTYLQVDDVTNNDLVTLDQLHVGGILAPRPNLLLGAIYLHFNEFLVFAPIIDSSDRDEN